jgi:hypothetical protein
MDPAMDNTKPLAKREHTLPTLDSGLSSIPHSGISGVAQRDGDKMGTREGSNGRERRVYFSRLKRNAIYATVSFVSIDRDGNHKLNSVLSSQAESGY